MQIKEFNLTESFVGRLTQKLSVPILSEILLLVVVLLFWYKGFFSSVGFGFLNGAAVSTGLLVLALLFADKSKIKITRAHIFLILFFVIALFSGVLAAARGITPVLIISGWMLFAQFLIAILAAQGVAKPMRLLKNIMYLSLPMAVVGAYQFLSHQTTSKLWVSPVETEISTRAFAFFGSPNVLGAVLVIVALVSAGLFFSDTSKGSPSRKTVFTKAMMGAIVGLAIVVAVFTFSRSAWLGLLAGILVVLLIKNWKFVFLSPLAAFVLLVPGVRTRISTIFTQSYWFDASLDGRLWSLNNGFHILAKHPLFGTGPGTYGGQLALNYSSPVYLEGIQSGYVALYFTDNQWLELLVQTGVLGLILFALFVAEMFYRLVSQYNKQKSATTLGILGAFVAFIVTGFFGNVLEFGAIAVPMGIMLGAGLSEND